MSGSDRISEYIFFIYNRMMIKVNSNSMGGHFMILFVRQHSIGHYQAMFLLEKNFDMNWILY